MSQLWEALLVAGAGAAAITALGVLFWWLAWPRISDYLDSRLAQLVDHAEENAKQLQPGGDVHDYAETAAAALPAIQQRLDDIEHHGTELSQQLVDRVTALEAEQLAVTHRLGVFEQALLALLGRELGNRIIRETDE